MTQKLTGEFYTSACNSDDRAQDSENSQPLHFHKFQRELYVSKTNISLVNPSFDVARFIVEQQKAKSLLRLSHHVRTCMCVWRR